MNTTAESSGPQAKTTVLCNGEVYSPADPFATAIAFDDAVVSWVGSDEAARAMDPEAIDLEGDFVAPGFVTAGLDLRASTISPAQLLAAGITSAHVVGTAEDLEDFGAAAGQLQVTGYALGAAAGPAAQQAAHLDLDQLATAPLFILVDDEKDEEAATALLADSDIRAHAQRSGWRLLFSGVVPPALIDPLSSAGVPLTLDPLRAGQPLGPLLAGGAQLSFVLDPTAPWRSLRAAIYEQVDGISGRAAFNCATRFAHRALGSFEGGVLAPGSAATAVRWAIADLVVQVADDRVAAWSTDPRSGTPGLPDLRDAGALPDVRRVWVDGAAVEPHGRDTPEK